MSDTLPEIDRDALALASYMFTNTEGITGHRMQAAVFGYLYADQHVKQEGNRWVYPGRAETVAAYEEYQKQELAAEREAMEEAFVKFQNQRS